MRHHEIDQYAKSSLLYPFDARVKIASTVMLIVVLALLTELLPLLLCLVFVTSLILVSGVPLPHVGKSYLIAFPFILFASLSLFYSSGAGTALTMFLRISDSVLALLLLASTTPFFELMKGMRWFRFPRALASLLLFTYRFIFVLIGELDRMRLARRARGFMGGRHLLHREAFRVIANTAGMVFVRSYRRARSIYMALLSRGYTGEVRTLNDMVLKKRDALLASSFILISVLAFFLQGGASYW